MLAAPLSVLSLIVALALPSDLSTAQAVRALSVGDAKAGRTVRIDGVVTFGPRHNNEFYFQDATGGVRVNWARTRELRPGQRVTVIGTTTEGAFLPEVRAAWVLTTGAPGSEHLPRPIEYTLAPDDAGYLDGRWVAVEAVVQRVWVHDDWLKYDLVRGRAAAIAHVPRPSAVAVKDALSTVGSVVALRGVCRVVPNAARQPSGAPHILVNESDIRETKNRRRDPTLLPLVRVQDLFAFRPDPIEARLQVRLEGVVTLNQGGKQVYVCDETGVVMAQSVGSVKVKPGDRVRVTGFPRASDPLRLENSQFEPLGTAPVPAPLPGTPTQAAAGKLEGHVVKFVGLVHEAERQGNWMTLTVVADGQSFTAVLLESLSEPDPKPPAVPGSTIEVVGAVTRQPLAGIRKTAFVVAVRPGGLIVLEVPPGPHPLPWWTGRRVAYLSAGFLGLLLLGGGAVTALRVQVRRARAQIRAESAEKVRLEGRLEQASQLEAVGRVAGGVAHDFNNILTVINGCAQLLDEGLSADPARAASLAADIRRAGRLATALNALLLAFSRQRAVVPHSIDVDAVIADAAPVLARLLPRGVAFCVTAAPGLPPARAETGMLLQVLINLTVNAGEAMPNGGTFSLTTSVPEPGWVRVTASDTGTGMAPDVLARAFERGFTTKLAGTGTGLSTVADVVRALGGRVRVRSEIGRGSEFEVDLPAAGPTALAPRTGTGEAPTARVAADTTAPPPGAPVVLVVDDEDSVRAFACFVLERAGFAVLAAAGPDAALELVASHTGPIDLLLTDLRMPGTNGHELAAGVRTVCPAVRVLFVSGAAPGDDEAADFLPKPFTAAQLTERVGRALGRTE